MLCARSCDTRAYAPVAASAERQPNVSGTRSHTRMDRFLLPCVVLLVMLAVAPAASAMLVDPVAVSAQACSIVGSERGDRLSGGAADDRVCGRGGADRIRGGRGGDALLGGGGGDLLQGKTGRDRLQGDAGNDRLFGGAGADWLRGGAGRDALGGGLGPDELWGGSGRDIAYFGQRTLAVRVTIGAGANDGVAGERDNVHGDVEDVQSGPGNDVLRGNGRSNRLSGGAGNDRLFGGRGNDVLMAGAGSDRIDARDGATATGRPAQTGFVDRVVCGDGQDTAFVDPGDVVDPDCENIIGGSTPPPTGGQPPTANPPAGNPPAPAAPNRSPVAVSATLVTDEDTPSAVTLAGSDPDGDTLGFATASAPAHGTLSGTGASRMYTPAADYAGTDSFSFSVSDGRGGTATATVAITVTAVNDAPRLTATTGAETFTESGGAIVIDDNVAVTDVDDSELTGATVTITSGLDATDDVLAFTPASGISGSYDAGTGTLTLTGTATVAAYEAALRTVTFDSPGANPTAGTRTVSFAADDGNDESAAVTRDVAMTVVNDAPVLTASGGSASHVEGAAAAEVDPALAIADPDSPTMAGATVEISGGLATGDELLFATQNGITGSFTGGTLTLTGTATRAQYETALRSVRYRTTSDDPSTADRTITFIVDDGSDESAAVTRNVTVAATNDAGSVTMSAGTVSYTEQAAPTTVDGNLTVADPDDTQLTGARVDITAGLDPADTLAFTPAGAITGTYSGGALVLSGTGTVAEYQAALRSVTFATAGDDPSTAPRTITFSVNDGDGLGPAGTRGLTVSAVNDAPVLAGTAGSASYIENGPGADVAPALTIADPDDTQLIGATVTITAGLDPADVLLFTNQNGITGSFAGGTLTLSGAASLDEYRDALRSVRFATAGDAPSTATRTVSFAVDDGTALSAAVTRDVTVTAVNDVPTVTTSAGAVTFTEGDGPVTIDAAVGLADPDSTQITGATVTISANYAGAEDVLAFNNTLTITGTVVGNTLTLTGTDTLVAYAAALGSVTFQNTSNAPATLPRQITFAATDAEGATGSGTRNLTVAGINSAPVLAPATGALAFAENDPPMAVAPAITVTDGDSTQIQGATVQVTSNFAAGEDMLTFTPSGAVTGSQSGNTLTLSGTDSLANYQTVLRSVRYQNSSDTPSTLTRTVTFTVTDDGGAASNAATRERHRGGDQRRADHHDQRRQPSRTSRTRPGSPSTPPSRSATRTRATPPARPSGSSRRQRRRARARRRPGHHRQLRRRHPHADRHRHDRRLPGRPALGDIPLDQRAPDQREPHDRVRRDRRRRRDEPGRRPHRRGHGRSTTRRLPIRPTPPARRSSRPRPRSTRASSSAIPTAPA